MVANRTDPFDAKFRLGRINQQQQQQQQQQHDIDNVKIYENCE